MTENSSEGSPPKAPISWFSFLPKFDLRLPLPKPESTIKDGNTAPPDVVVVDEAGERANAQKPDFVSFPKSDLVVRSVEAEADVSGKTSNPAVIWQVYALGGFLILSWAWARWKERRPQNRSNNDGEDRDSSDT